MEDFAAWAVKANMAELAAKRSFEGGTDQTFASKILCAMNRERNGGDAIDVPGSLNHFHDSGGHCDCEILFNMDL